jgi:F420-non-reducing hydrogenase large subunit
MRHITIDPITRLEGHGKIDIYLDEHGAVNECFLVVPELRGFEKFAEGRPIEEMPRITSRICGVCPEAHMMASAKAGDAAYGITIPPAAKKLRELQYAAFFLGDHTTHFYALGGPDLIMGPDAEPAKRNVLGLLEKLGVDPLRSVLAMRKECHEVARILGGKPIHPVNALPGGVSKPLTKDEHARLQEIAARGLAFAKQTIQVFDEVVLANPTYIEMLQSDPYQLRVHTMGLVDGTTRVNFYEGDVRVVDTRGAELVRYAPEAYLEHIAEHVESWTYLKFPYLKAKGWKGLVEGQDSGVYRATPLSRLNVAEGMATPLAHEQYERLYAVAGTKVVHSTLATHWARVIELVYAAERFDELVRDPEILDTRVRAVPTGVPREGVGVVEAPRGTLTHHYVTDDNGIVVKANLIVGTTNNHAAICMSIKKAARALIRPGVEPDEGLLNRIEMAFRAYDPCFGCATHTLPGEMPLEVRFRRADGEIVSILRRD